MVTLTRRDLVREGFPLHDEYMFNVLQSIGDHEEDVVETILAAVAHARWGQHGDRHHCETSSAPQQRKPLIKTDRLSFLPKARVRKSVASGYTRATPARSCVRLVCCVILRGRYWSWKPEQKIMSLFTSKKNLDDVPSKTDYLSGAIVCVTSHPFPKVVRRAIPRLFPCSQAAP